MINFKNINKHSYQNVATSPNQLAKWVANEFRLQPQHIYFCMKLNESYGDGLDVNSIHGTDQPKFLVFQYLMDRYTGFSQYEIVLQLKYKILKNEKFIKAEENDNWFLAAVFKQWPIKDISLLTKEELFEKYGDNLNFLTNFF